MITWEPRLCVLIIASMAGAICLSAQPEIERDRTAEDKICIRLIVGEELIIRTEPEPLTGYHWIAGISNSEVITQTGAPLLESQAPHLLGGLQQTRFNFKALAPGETEIHFSFILGTGNPNIPPSDHFEAQIIVRRDDS